MRQPKLFDKFFIIKRSHAQHQFHYPIGHVMECTHHDVRFLDHDRWLICDGRRKKAVDHPDLYEHLTGEDQDMITEHTTFRVPDYRGDLVILWTNPYRPDNLYPEDVGNTDCYLERIGL